MIATLNSLRVMTTAYLFHKDSVLLMKRSSQRSFIPGVWSGVGGHVHSNEFADIKAACFREIEEETGLRLTNIQSFSLKYVLLRIRNNELRQQFVYFGTTNTNQIGVTDEGTLHWIPSNHVFEYRMTDSNRLMLEHYFDNPPSNEVWVGTMRGDEMQPQTNWALMSDWE